MADRDEIVLIRHPHNGGVSETRRSSYEAYYQHQGYDLVDKAEYREHKEAAAAAAFGLPYQGTIVTRDEPNENLARLRRDELVERAEAIGVPVSEEMTKAEIIEAMEADVTARAEEGA